MAPAFLRHNFLLALAIAFVAALVCRALDSPLPWLIGPLFATAAFRMGGVDLACPAAIRAAGQWVIGAALGLYFTPPVLAILTSYLGFIAAGVAFAVLLGAICGWMLHRMSGVDRTTAFFAMAIGGASEMAGQGERYGALVDRVAAAHSLRMMLVVAIIPFGFQLAGVQGADPYSAGTEVVQAGGMLLLVAATVAGALLLRALGTPTPWVLGPLLVALALTAYGIELSALPEWVIRTGQLFIGISLGTRFSPDFLHTAPRFLASAAACTLLAMVLGVGFAFGLVWASGMHPATAILATSPGGIAEMTLTAKTLNLGVPIVTAFHVTRLCALVLMIGPLFRALRWMQRPAEQVQR